MSVKDNKKMHLSFLFTSEGFRPDIFQNEDEIKIWTGETAYRSLYQFGMEGKPEDATPSAGFLYQVAAAFFARLTDLPELELVRENAKVSLSSEALEELLAAVPFVIGAEYVTEGWIKSVFSKLNDIFAEEIAGLMDQGIIG